MKENRSPPKLNDGNRNFARGIISHLSGSEGERKGFYKTSVERGVVLAGRHRIDSLVVRALERLLRTAFLPR